MMPKMAPWYWTDWVGGEIAEGGDGRGEDKLEGHRKAAVPAQTWARKMASPSVKPARKTSHGGRCRVQTPL